jgi:hypothetical protein
MGRGAEAVNSLLRNWCEAEWAVRAVYFVLAAEIGIGIYLAAALWLG